MTDLLITSVLASLAITYVIEILDLITYSFFGKGTLNRVLTLPLSFGALFSQIHIRKELIIAVPAVTFASIAISKYINKPVVINNISRGR